MVPEFDDYGQAITNIEEFTFPIDLPSNYTYCFEKFSWIDKVTIKFHAEFRVNCNTQEKAIEWFNAFQEISCSSMKSDRKKKKVVNSRTYSYKERFLCKHGYSFSRPDIKTNQHG